MAARTRLFRTVGNSGVYTIPREILIRDSRPSSWQLVQPQQLHFRLVRYGLKRLPRPTMYVHETLERSYFQKSTRLEHTR